MRVFAGDVGGTKTLLAVAEVEGTRVSVLAEKRFASRDFSTFVELAQPFLRDAPAFGDRACIGVAGPVVGGRAVVTKLPWRLAEEDLTRQLGLPRLKLINDFAAIARGIDCLEASDIVDLNTGQSDPNGPLAILGAGTGLGEAFSVVVGGRHVVIPSEGGHADFAPRDETEIDLLRYMTTKYGRCSYDRILSGPGMADLYRFFRDTGRGKESDELREAIASAPDPAPVVTEFALDRGDPLCLAAVDLFCTIYGAEAGNLALKVVATGGVYIAGGIAPRILDRLRRGGFARAYVEKGRVSPVVKSIPARVILTGRVGLLGAAIAAADPDEDAPFPPGRGPG